MHWLVTALIAALVLAPSASHGQVTSGKNVQTQVAIGAPNSITTSMRLSDWLLAQPTDPNAYPLGLSWRVPGEEPAQAELRLELLRILSGLDREVRADPEVLRRLRDWVIGLPVTGRVRVALPDARWLQANVARDPMLQPGHSVVLPKRPRTVTVITAQGTRCVVTHAAANEAMAYVQSCASPDFERLGWFRGSQPDWVWVAQPDGRVQRFGVAAWNREAQDEPAPGAWIWAPPWDGGFSERLSQQLIAFLATQGPAADIDRGEGAAIAEKQIPRVAPRRKSPWGARNDNIGIVGGPPPGRSVSDIGTGRGEGAAPAKPGSASPAWMPSGLPELGGTAQRLRDRRGAGETGTADANKALVLPAPSPSARSRSLATTASDWGGVGLLQTPSARMEQAGNLTVNFSRIYPYLQGNIMVQPLDWLEAGFRYTNVSNRLYSGVADFSGDQAYKDKSFDAKFRLWTESAYVPQVAVGFRDFAGTGLFSGEYLVASKRTGPLDWSLGMGWGNVGARGNLRNPLGRLIPSFDTRTTDTGQGGSFSFGSYFHGPTALFGGVQYQTPWEPLILKLEYDGNDYQHEGLGNILPQSSPWNFGMVYRAGRVVDVTLGVERGNTAMLGVTLHTQLDGLSVPKLNDPPRIPVALIRPQRAPDWSVTSRDIAAQTDWHVRRIEQRGRELRVTLDDAQATYWRERADRAAAVLNRDAPASVDRFTLSYRQRGVDVAEHVIERDAWVAAQTQPLPPREERATLIARAPETLPQGNALYDIARPRFETNVGPNYQQTLGGPDSFLLFQIGVVGNAKLRLRDDTWLQGTVQLGLYDNYDKFSVTGPSNLPRVRTYLREYVTTSQITIPNLQATHVGRLSDNQYYSVYTGYLEPYFGGIGAEWLYRPFASRVALGVDANLVKQRSFEQDLSFDKAGDQTGYRVATGHATLYWDTGWNGVQANLSVGRYLAKDFGATVELSRVFKNGVKFGAFFSKTNISAEQFGEGSFDKGVYLSVPFDAFLTRSSTGTATAIWKPLTRDGGAKLSRFVQLYDITRARDDRTLRFKAAPPRNDESIPSDRRDSWTPPPKGPEPYTRVAPQPETGKWVADAQAYEQRLVDALYRQQFRNIRVTYDASRRLTVALSNDSLHPVSRAVGRAARTALHLGPLDMREIRIEFAQGADSAVTYDFADLRRLQRYFDGEISAAQLADSVAVDYRDPSAREADPLARLDDVETRVDAPRLADVLQPVARPVRRVASDFANAGRTAADMDWLRMGAIGGGLVLASSVLDRRADQFAQDHGQNRYVKAGNNFGNALPWLAIAGAGAAALDGSDPVRSRTGYAALEAGGTAFLAVTGLKTVFGRARPDSELGNHAFKPLSTASGYDSLPSGHTIIAWAVATPFAEEYDAPWLYGLAAVTNLARVGSRNHWLSDTVAGSALGYAIGRVFWESARKPQNGSPRVLIHPAGVNVAWTFN